MTSSKKSPRSLLSGCEGSRTQYGVKKRVVAGAKLGKDGEQSLIGMSSVQRLLEPQVLLEPNVGVRAREFLEVDRYLCADLLTQSGQI